MNVMRPINEERMQRTLDYITKYQIAEGVSPTYRQIMEDCNYNTINTVAKDIQRLKERGLLESDNSTGFNRIGSLFQKGVSDSHNSLIVGSVPCGQPSPALEDIETAVSLPDAIFGRADHIILHAKGLSMIKRGIFEGDYLVVRRQETADLGQTIIAMLEGGESTCKILAKDDRGKYYLMAANDTVDEKGKRIYDVFPKGDWRIFGVVDYVIHAPVCDEL